MADTIAWPTELRLAKDRKVLTVAFEGGDSFALPAEYLRVKSPSAEVQGHSPDERKTVPGKRDVGIIQVLPVGNYAVRLVFDDLHSTGIFGWDYLLDLGRNYARYWQDYVDELAAKTAMFEQMTKQHIDYMLSKIPRGRFVTVDEIAAMVAFCASADCSFTTGAVFDISGGRATY